jgi:hypothetical protein
MEMVVITAEQEKQAEREFEMEAASAFQKAKALEKSLEHYTYSQPRREYDPKRRERLLQEFLEADYIAESRAWILQLIRGIKRGSVIPHDAICYFKDGDRMCAVFGDFVDLQSSPSGFGSNFEEAFEALAHTLAKTPRFVGSTNGKPD